MSFWTDNKLKEPLRQNKWFLRFAAPEGGVSESVVFALKDCKKPKYNIGVSEHRLLNHMFRYPGIVKWEPVDIKFVSARGKSGKEDIAYIFYNLLEKSGYFNPEKDQSSFISKSDSTNYFANASLEIIQVDSNGKEIENWFLENPFISSVDFGTLSYGSEELVEVSVSVQYDYATLSTSDTAEPTVNSNSPKNVPIIVEATEKAKLELMKKKASNFDKGKIPPLDVIQTKKIQKDWYAAIAEDDAKKDVTDTNIGADKKFSKKPQDYNRSAQVNVDNIKEGIVHGDPYNQVDNAIDQLLKSGKISYLQASLLRSDTIIQVQNENLRTNKPSIEEPTDPIYDPTIDVQNTKLPEKATDQPAREDFKEREEEAKIAAEEARQQKIEKIQQDENARREAAADNEFDSPERDSDGEEDPTDDEFVDDEADDEENATDEPVVKKDESLKVDTASDSPHLTEQPPSGDPDPGALDRAVKDGYRGITTPNRDSSSVLTTPRRESSEVLKTPTNPDGSVKEN